MFLKNIQELGIEANSQKQVEYGKNLLKGCQNLKVILKEKKLQSVLGLVGGEKSSPYLQRQVKGSVSFEVCLFYQGKMKASKM